MNELNNPQKTDNIVTTICVLFIVDIFVKWKYNSIKKYLLCPVHIGS